MIDIPDRYIDAVKGLMLMQADSEQEAQKTNRAADLLKQATEPIIIDTTDAGIFGGGVARSYISPSVHLPLRR